MVLKTTEAKRLINAARHGHVNDVQSLCHPSKLRQIPQDKLDEALFAAIEGAIFFKFTEPRQAEHCWQITMLLCSLDSYEVSERSLNMALRSAISADRIDVVRRLATLHPPHSIPSTEAIHAAVHTVMGSRSAQRWEFMVCLCRMGISEDLRTLVFKTLADADQWHFIDLLYIAGLQPQQMAADFMLHKAAKDGQWEVFQKICSLQEPSQAMANQLLKMAVRSHQTLAAYSLCELHASNLPNESIVWEAITIAKKTGQPAVAYYLKAHHLAAPCPNPLSAIYTLLQDYIKQGSLTTRLFKTDIKAINQLEDILAVMPKAVSIHEEEWDKTIRDIIFSLKRSPLYTSDLRFISLVNYIAEQYTDNHYIHTDSKYNLQ